MQNVLLNVFSVDGNPTGKVTTAGGQVVIDSATGNLWTRPPQAPMGSFDYFLLSSPGASGETGTAAYAYTGDKGHTVPFVDGHNHWSAIQVFEDVIHAPGGLDSNAQISGGSFRFIDATGNSVTLRTTGILPSSRVLLIPDNGTKLATTDGTNDWRSPQSFNAGITQIAQIASNLINCSGAVVAGGFQSFGAAPFIGGNIEFTGPVSSTVLSAPDATQPRQVTLPDADGVVALTSVANDWLSPQKFAKGIEIEVPEFLNNAAAIEGGLTKGRAYRTGDLLKIVH